MTIHPICPSPELFALNELNRPQVHQDDLQRTKMNRDELRRIKTERNNDIRGHKYKDNDNDKDNDKDKDTYKVPENPTYAIFLKS